MITRDQGCNERDKANKSGWSKSNCKHQEWFNDTHKKLLEKRNTARVRKLQVNTRSNRTKLTGTRRSLKQYTRQMKSQRWEAKEAEKKDMKELLK